MPPSANPSSPITLKREDLGQSDIPNTRRVQCILQVLHGVASSCFRELVSHAGHGDADGWWQGLLPREERLRIFG